MDTAASEEPNSPESGGPSEEKSILKSHAADGCTHIDTCTCNPDKIADRNNNSPVHVANVAKKKGRTQKRPGDSTTSSHPSSSRPLDFNSSPQSASPVDQSGDPVPLPSLRVTLQHVESTVPSARHTRPPSPLTTEEAALVSSFAIEGIGNASPVNQADFDNDARTRVPYRIKKETFHVPVVNHDDLLSEAERNWAPGKPLRMAMVTWNMASHSAKVTEVSSYCIHPNAHIVVVGTQENGAYVSGNGKQNQWLKEVKENCLKGLYELVGKKHLWALNLLVFARKRDVAAYVTKVHCSHVKTGMLNGAGGNKGGVAVAIVMSMEARKDFARTTAARIEQREQQRSTGKKSTHHHEHHREHHHHHTDKYHTHTVSCDVAETPQERSFAQEVTASTHARRPSCGEHSATSPHRSFAVSSSGITNGVDTEDVQFSSPSSPLPPNHDGPATAVASGFPPQRSVPAQLTFLFINAHLAAHQGAVSKRNKDYKRIVKELRVGRHGKYRTFFRKIASKHERWHDEEEVLSGEDDITNDDATGTPDHISEESDNASRNDVTLLRLPPVSQSEAIKPCRDVTEEFDLTYFMGDLNYRINGTRQAIEYIVKEHRNIRSILVNNDQLSLERAKGRVFHNFHEGKLLFRPTYKYEVSSGVTLDQYNFSSKKNRMPAYCDRVLYKKRRGSAVGKVAIRLYTDVPYVRTSDHRPVVAIFDVETVASENAMIS